MRGAAGIGIVAGQDQRAHPRLAQRARRRRYVGGEGVSVSVEVRDDLAVIVDGRRVDRRRRDRRLPKIERAALRPMPVKPGDDHTAIGNGERSDQSEVAQGSPIASDGFRAVLTETEAGAGHLPLSPVGEGCTISPTFTGFRSRSRPPPLEIVSVPGPPLLLGPFRRQRDTRPPTMIQAGPGAVMTVTRRSAALAGRRRSRPRLGCGRTPPLLNRQQRGRSPKNADAGGARPRSLVRSLRHEDDHIARFLPQEVSRLFAPRADLQKSTAADYGRRGTALDRDTRGETVDGERAATLIVRPPGVTQLAEIRRSAPMDLILPPLLAPVSVSIPVPSSASEPVPVGKTRRRTRARLRWLPATHQRGAGVGHPGSLRCRPPDAPSASDPIWEEGITAIASTVASIHRDRTRCRPMAKRVVRSCTTSAPALIAVGDAASLRVQSPLRTRRARARHRSDSSGCRRCPIWAESVARGSRRRRVEGQRAVVSVKLPARVAGELLRRCRCR